MMEYEGYIGYGAQGYTLVNRKGCEVAVLCVGNEVELLIGDAWQAVSVHSSGYKGWYYVLPNGQRARFAVSMSIRAMIDGCQVIARLVIPARQVV